MSQKERIQNLLNSLTAESSSARFVFPKSKHRIRLCEDPEENICLPVQSEFQGKQKTKYLFLGYSADDNPPEWKGIVVPKTVARAILELTTEFALFDSKKGHGVLITRSGEGLSSTYSVIPSREPKEIPPEMMNSRPKLQELCEEYQSLKESRKTQSGSEEAEETTPW